MGLGVNVFAEAQIIKDPPLNSEHIDHLPADVRRAVLAMCPKPASAGHYFGLYLNNSQQINLHFEHFNCEGRSYCNSSGCLHQTYRLGGGHYRLAKSFYASGND